VNNVSSLFLFPPHKGSIQQLECTTTLHWPWYRFSGSVLPCTAKTQTWS